MDTPMLPLKNKGQKLTSIVLASLLVFLGACATAKLNQNLDTKVTSIGRSITLSWSEQHPFANEYNQQNISLVAEYKEQYRGGQVRPVRQIIGTRNRYNRTANATAFELPESLRSLPAAGPVCLYFESNRRAIPIRSSGANGTARFQHREWADMVGNKMKKVMVEKDLRVAVENVKVVNQSLSNLVVKNTNRLKDYNQRILNENLAYPVNIKNQNDCSGIQLAPQELKKPRDVFKIADISGAAEKICAHRSKVGVGYLGKVSVLPYAFAVKKIDVANLFSNRKKQLESFSKIFIKHYANVGPKSDFQPELGAKVSHIGISSYVKPMQIEAYKYLDQSTPMSKEQKNLVNKVVGIELEAFENCVSESKQQLKTKSLSWKAKLATAPEREVAKEKFVTKQCNALFIENEKTSLRLERDKKKADNDLQRIQAQAEEISGIKPLSLNSNILNGIECYL